MQSSRRTSGRIVVWLAGLLAVGIPAAILCGFMIKWESEREVGGKWKLVLAKPILASEPGWSWARLYRNAPVGRACVASDVWKKPEFYGDDCVGYEVSRASGRRYFFACGDREPLLAVTVEAYEEWRLTEKGLEPAPVMNDMVKLVPSSEKALAADELEGSTDAAFAHENRVRLGVNVRREAGLGRRPGPSNNALQRTRYARR